MTVHLCLQGKYSTALTRLSSTQPQCIKTTVIDVDNTILTFYNFSLIYARKQLSLGHDHHAKVDKTLRRYKRDMCWDIFPGLERVVMEHYTKKEVRNELIITAVRYLTGHAEIEVVFEDPRG